MKGIFWGFFLIFINFYVTINGHTLNLLPTFAGYILLYRAAGELLGESGNSAPLLWLWPYTRVSCGWETCWA